MEHYINEAGVEEYFVSLANAVVAELAKSGVNNVKLTHRETGFQSRFVFSLEHNKQIILSPDYNSDRRQPVDMPKDLVRIRIVNKGNSFYNGKKNSVFLKFAEGDSAFPALVKKVASWVVRYEEQEQDFLIIRKQKDDAANNKQQALALFNSTIHAMFGDKLKSAYPSTGVACLNTGDHKTVSIKHTIPNRVSLNIDLDLNEVNDFVTALVNANLISISPRK